MDKNLIEKKDKELFDRIAKRYAKKDQINYCRVARKLRLESTLRNTLKPIESILEIGCGCGYTVDYLSNQINRFVGIDYSEELIKYAKRYNSKKDVEFLCQNIKDFKTEEKFDYIIFLQNKIKLNPIEDTMLMSYALDAGRVRFSGYRSVAS